MVRNSECTILNCMIFILEKTKRSLLENSEFFEWQDKQIVDESKRPNKNTTHGYIFGFGNEFNGDNESGFVNF